MFSLSFQNCISQSFFLRILFGKYSQHFTRHVTALFKNGWSLHLTFPHTKKFAWNSWNFITNKAHVPSDVNTVQHCRSTFGLVFRTQNLVSSGVFCKLSAGCHVPLYHTVQRSDCVNIGRHFSRKDTETNITTQLRAFFFCSKLLPLMEDADVCSLGSCRNICTYSQHDVYFTVLLKFLIYDQKPASIGSWL